MADDLEVGVLPAHDNLTSNRLNTGPQARLKSHSRAFEGLMSLIPAKEYYGKDASITSVSSPRHSNRDSF